ncbi:MAG: (Fe-S)-binding protein [Syntrophobacterales bacterium]
MSTVPCSSLNSSKPGRPRPGPLDLLAIAGLECLPTQDEDTCCGMGGSYSMVFSELSAELLKKKLDAVEATGADLLVIDCPGCVLQLKGGLDIVGISGVIKALQVSIHHWF